MFQQDNTLGQSRTVTCQLTMKTEEKEKREKKAKNRKETKVRKTQVTPPKLRCITKPFSITSAIFINKNKEQG